MPRLTPCHPRECISPLLMYGTALVTTAEQPNGTREMMSGTVPLRRVTGAELALSTRLLLGSAAVELMAALAASAQ